MSGLGLTETCKTWESPEVPNRVLKVVEQITKPMTQTSTMELVQFKTGL
jgi:hypothetical protein